MIINKRYMHCACCEQVTLAEKFMHWDDTVEEYCSKCGTDVSECEVN